MTLRRTVALTALLAGASGSGLAQVPPKFVDATDVYFLGSPWPPTNHAAFGDFNNDGWVDLMAGGNIYANRDGKRFARLDSPILIGASIWGDYDNDGLLDAFAIINKTVWRNLGRATGSRRAQFSKNVAMPRFPMIYSRGAAWVDLQNDGLLDLYVGGFETTTSYEPDVMVLGSGAADSFSLWWTQSGDIDPARGVAAADFDNDGDQDIYVSNYRLERNLLFVNHGRSFNEEGVMRGVAGDYDGYSWSYGHSVGSAWGDLDDDGNLDLFVGNLSHSWGLPDQDICKFYRNEGEPRYDFEDMTSGAGLNWQESYATPALADFDNDGDLDLYLTTVYPGDTPVLYRNEGGWVFTDVTSATRLSGISPTNQAAWADVNGDGWLDLMTGGRLYINQGRGHHWIKVRLDGVGATFNRAAIGAQVRVFLQGKTMTRQVEGSTGEGNQNDLTLHFGLGGYNGLVLLEITWPDGSKQVETVRPDRLTVITPAGIVR